MGLRRWLLPSAAVAFVLGTAGTLPASAAVQRTYRIGVDNAAPKGHDWLYVDFFPRQGVKVHRGDVLDFSWNKGSLDGAHNVTVLPAGASTQPFVVQEPAGDDAAGQLEANPVVFGPSDPNCGTSVHPCNFTGTARVNSGFAPTAPGNDFFVEMNLPRSDDPVTVNFVCEIHPGMHGSVSVVPDAAARSRLDQVEDAAAAQFHADTRGAFDAEYDVENHAVTRNADGTHTVAVTAGTATPFVEVAEMLPRKIDIEKNDKVNWVTKTIRDIHTVTFPQGAGSNSVDPLQTFCEGAVDTPAVSPANCNSPSDYETHVDPQPIGPTAISSSSTVATSGIIANPPTPFPNNFTFSFPTNGSFVYQCRIHDHMIGTVVVD
jgi:plastocyanin